MPEMTALQAAGLWSGLLILLMVGLAFRVVANRRRHRVLFGDGGVQGGHPGHDQFSRATG